MRVFADQVRVLAEFLGEDSENHCPGEIDYEVVDGRVVVNVFDFGVFVANQGDARRARAGGDPERR